MAFNIIENITKSSSAGQTIPVAGVKVTARKLTRAAKMGGGEVRFIRIEIGALLATAISLVDADRNVHVLFGTDCDAGKLAISVDNVAGDFKAKRNKSGGYALTISQASADGLFALEFPTFTIDKCEAIRPENGKPPQFVFKASAEMLAVDD